MHTEESRFAEDIRAALGPIMRQNSGRWLRHIMGILRNQADAEDVLQEAVRRVLARNQPLPSQEHVRLYLARAVGNAALEFYNHRKRKRIRQIPVHEGICLPDQDSGPFDQLERKERIAEENRLLRIVRRGLAHLPRKQYEAVRLTILESEGLSIRDIGTINGIPYSTLRHRSQQGLRRLRRFVEQSLRKEDQELKKPA